MSSSQIPFALFEFLDDTHRNIHAHLMKLRNLVETIHFPTLKPVERLALERICLFFDTEAKEHHLDEELHIFPVLQKNTDPNVKHLADQLQQDHGWIEENWLELAPQLKAVINQNLWIDESELLHGLNIFELLNIEHMQLEESTAYPKVKLAITELDPATIGREMSKRRKYLPEKNNADSTKSI